MAESDIAYLPGELAGDLSGTETITRRNMGFFNTVHCATLQSAEVQMSHHSKHESENDFHRDMRNYAAKEG